jgi:hypothetical protein
MLLLVPHISAGPLEFGLNQVNAALAERNLKWKVRAELSLDPPESYRIEPYSSGAARVTGGDLRGLMYGLLEAASQIRTTGRFAKATGAAVTPLRGVRLALTPEWESAPEEFWRSYFQMLAQNRFNRAHVIFRRLQAPYQLERQLAQIAADYAVDFTLGVESAVDFDGIRNLLTASPLIHSIAVEPGSPSADAWIEAARRSGRRVTIDLDGAPPFDDFSVPTVRPLVSWPPSFEVSPPFDILRADHGNFYWIWGRYGYDPATKPPKGSDPALYGAAREAVLWIAAASQAQNYGSEFVATAEEAARLQASGMASAKLTPAGLAERLDGAAARLERATEPDLLRIAEMARSRAKELRDASERYGASAADESVPQAASESIPRPQIAHVPPTSAPADQPLTLRLRMSLPIPPSAQQPSRNPSIRPPQVKAPAAPELTVVRLHYRLLEPGAKETVVEANAGSEITFTIPAAELTGNWDLQYYFEILSRDGTGWFEPDPLNAMPIPVVRIVAPRSGPN